MHGFQHRSVTYIVVQLLLTCAFSTSMFSDQNPRGCKHVLIDTYGSMDLHTLHRVDIKKLSSILQGRSKH